MATINRENDSKLKGKRGAEVAELRMRRVLSIMVLSLGYLLSCCVTADDTIHFYYDYQTAVKEAKATGRPIFLEFRCAP